jgi:hypothetical protein
MAAPTQAFPPWLSPLPVTVTQDGTVVVQTTVVQFPQTYYGPSVSLDFWRPLRANQLFVDSARPWMGVRWLDVSSVHRYIVRFFHAEHIFCVDFFS